MRVRQRPVEGISKRGGEYFVLHGTSTNFYVWIVEAGHVGAKPLKNHCSGWIVGRSALYNTLSRLAKTDEVSFKRQLRELLKENPYGQA